jgi:hypothetical protein
MTRDHTLSGELTISRRRPGRRGPGGNRYGELKDLAGYEPATPGPARITARMVRSKIRIHPSLLVLDGGSGRQALL